MRGSLRRGMLDAEPRNVIDEVSLRGCEGQVGNGSLDVDVAGGVAQVWRKVKKCDVGEERMQRIEGFTVWEFQGSPKQ